MARLFISAAHKSSGKTTLSVGLAAAFARDGRRVQTFKKGPDYIDPMWLARASGRPCYNLDFNTQSRQEIEACFAVHAAGADLALIEGNKGLHDGIDLEGGDSSAALAKLMQAPVLLVIDVVGMTRGIAPLLIGYRQFDAGVTVAGVILNKVGPARQETKLRQAIERYTDIPVLGAIGRAPALRVDERHLGLTPPSETAGFDRTIERIRAAVSEGVDLERVVAVARAATPLPPALPRAAAALRDVTIAVAQDSAFGFYYPDDFEALERAGARLVFFDALHDARLPDADGLFIGGGFPETQAAQLAANAALRADVGRRIRAGLPTYAECGGLMYLTRSIRWRTEAYAMVGVIAADTLMGDQPQGRGLVVLEETDAAPWPHGAAQHAALRIPAHEFHYARLENLDPRTCFAYRVVRGHGIDGRHDGIVQGNVVASFSHLRDTARSHWAERFVAFVRATMERRMAGESDREPLRRSLGMKA